MDEIQDIYTACQFATVSLRSTVNTPLVLSNVTFVTATKCTYLFFTYIDCVSPTCFAVKFIIIIRENFFPFKPHAVVGVIVYSYCNSCVVIYRRQYNFVFTTVTVFNGLLRNSSEYFKILQNTSHYFRILQNISEYFRIFHINSHYFRIFQNTSKHFETLQTSKYFRLLQNTSKYFKLLQNISKYFKILQNTSEYFKIIQNISKDFSLIQNI